MKKLIIGLFSLTLFIGVNAQESEVLSAYEYMKVYNYEKDNGNMAVAIENLIRAKDAIDAASVNEKTMLKSKTWKRRADVYVKLFVEKDPQLKGSKTDYLNAAYESIMKALTIEVNPKNNEPKIAEEDELRGRAKYVGDTISALGAQSYQNKDYQVASVYFEKTYNLYKQFGITDTGSYRNIFLAAYLGNDPDKAITIGNELIKMNYNDPSIYGTMAQIYQKKGEGAKGLQIIKDARAKFPKRTEFVTEELNYYLTVGDDANAARIMDEAIVIFKDDKSTLKALYFNSGVIFAKLGDKEKSRDYYKKALAEDALYFGALNNLASSYLDEANIYIKEATLLPLSEQKKFDELKAKSDALYLQAGTLLENAYIGRESEIAKENDPAKKNELIVQQGKLKKALLDIFYNLKDEAKIEKYK